MLAATTSASAVATVCESIRMLKSPQQMQSLRLVILIFATNNAGGIDMAVSKKRRPRNLSDPGAFERLERNTGFEPATFALARRRSVAETRFVGSGDAIPPHSKSSR